MALSDDQILDVAATTQLYNHALPAIRFARAIEAEVRKQDDALILQLVEALENHDGNYKLSKSAGEAVDAAITAGRARLEPMP